MTKKGKHETNISTILLAQCEAQDSALKAAKAKASMAMHGQLSAAMSCDVQSRVAPGR